LPEALGTLGLPETELKRHIAWDLGRSMSPAGCRGCSVPRWSSSVLAAGLGLQPAAGLARRHAGDQRDHPYSGQPEPHAGRPPGGIRRIYRPFHAAIAELLDRRAAEGVRSMVVTVHSFTPLYKGTRRIVELGILHDRDTHLSQKLIASFPGVDARLNGLYGPTDGVLHTLNLHAAPRGLAHVTIEMRDDLITEERG
jgi:predicted N-formylglutamate amidohydrolase